MSLVKNGNPTFNKLKSCGIRNLPDVARKKSRPAIITIKIKFLYNLGLPNEFVLALDLKINKIIKTSAKTINNRIIYFSLYLDNKICNVKFL